MKNIVENIIEKYKDKDVLLIIDYVVHNYAVARVREVFFKGQFVSRTTHLRDIYIFDIKKYNWKLKLFSFIKTIERNKLLKYSDNLITGVFISKEIEIKYFKIKEDDDFNSFVEEDDFNKVVDTTENHIKPLLDIIRNINDKEASLFLDYKMNRRNLYKIIYYSDDKKEIIEEDIEYYICNNSKLEQIKPDSIQIENSKKYRFLGERFDKIYGIDYIEFYFKTKRNNKTLIVSLDIKGIQNDKGSEYFYAKRGRYINIFNKKYIKIKEHK